MAENGTIAPTPDTGAFRGCCWVLPPSDLDATAEQVNAAMQKRVIDVVGDALFLIDTGLLLADRQIVVVLSHGGQANLFVCDSMEVHQ